MQISSVDLTYQRGFRIDPIFIKAGLECITGINQKQLWHCASGARNPYEVWCYSENAEKEKCNQL